MRLLVDENLSNRVASRLTAGGHDAVHVTDVGLGNTDDHVILDWAAANDRTIVTSDTAFGALLPSQVRCGRQLSCSGLRIT